MEMSAEPCHYSDTSLISLGDTLGGHLDDMEADWSKPIVSMRYLANLSSLNCIPVCYVKEDIDLQYLFCYLLYPPAPVWVARLSFFWVASRDRIRP